MASSEIVWIAGPSAIGKKTLIQTLRCKAASKFDPYRCPIVPPAGGVKVQCPEQVRSSRVGSILDAD